MIPLVNENTKGARRVVSLIIIQPTASTQIQRVCRQTLKDNSSSIRRDCTVIKTGLICSGAWIECCSDTRPILPVDDRYDTPDDLDLFLVHNRPEK